MTNFNIIVDAAIESGLFTKEEAINYIKTRGALPLHTFSEWKRHGYTVKKGERAKLTVFIWRYKEKKKQENEEENKIEIANNNDFYKTKAFFFTAEQVQRI